MTLFNITLNQEEILQVLSEGVIGYKGQNLPHERYSPIVGQLLYVVIRRWNNQDNQNQHKERRTAG